MPESMKTGNILPLPAHLAAGLPDNRRGLAPVHLENRFDLLWRKPQRPAQGLGQVNYPRGVLQGLHPVVGLEHIAAQGQGPVIGEQEDFMLIEIFFQLVGQPGGAGSSVRDQRHFAQGEHRLRQDLRVHGAAGRGKGRGVKRVRMHRGFNIRPLAVNPRVNPDLAEA